MKVGLLWLINDDEVLIARRADGMDSDAGVWGLSVSGAIEPDETDKEGILRETQEELGIDITGLAPVHLHNETYLHKDGEVRDFRFFYAKTDADVVKRIKLEPAEVAEVRWISIPDLKNFTAIIRNKSSSPMHCSCGGIYSPIWIKSLARPRMKIYGLFKIFLGPPMIRRSHEKA